MKTLRQSQVNRRRMNAVQASVTYDTDARAYFDRMPAPQSKTFKDAVNAAIVRWKADGVWDKLIDLNLHCTGDLGSALVSLRGLVPVTLAGTAASFFVPDKGFFGSTWSSSNYLFYPYNTALHGGSSSARCAFALKDKGSGANGQMISGVSTSNTSVPGALSTLGGTLYGSGINSGNGLVITNRVAAGVWGSFQMAFGGMCTAPNGSSDVADATGYQTVYNNSDNRLGGMIAYGFLAAVTEAQARKFAATFATLLETLGALD